MFAYSYIGKRYDCGSKLGFLEATVDFALKHPQLGAEFQQLVNRIADARSSTRQPRAVRARAVRAT